MKVPWKWLNEYMELDWTVEETCERLTHAGVKVENLTFEKLDLSGVVSALVEDVSRHPSRPDLKVGTLTQAQTVHRGERRSGLARGNIVLWPRRLGFRRVLLDQGFRRNRVSRHGRVLMKYLAESGVTSSSALNAP